MMVGKVINCTNYGSVEGTYNDDINIGGIVGGSYGTTVEIINCGNHGAIYGTPMHILEGSWVRMHP